MSWLSVRVKIPSNGNLLAAIVDNNGVVHSFSRMVKVTYGSTPHSQAGVSGGFDPKYKVTTEGEQVLAKIWAQSPMSTSDYLSKAVLIFGQGDSIDVDITPWASRNPLLGIKVPSPSGASSYTLNLVTNRGETSSYQGGF